MSGHDIIVIGSSAGGLKALTAIVGNLPADMEAALFIVQHLSAEHQSFLAEILTDTGALRASHPENGERIVKGHIYVAPPDHHMLIERGRLRVVRGPRENLFRPSVDTLFRSAARAYGPRVIGVILTGHLDDGTVGLQAVKKRGGCTVVQDPGEAEYPSMPVSALRYAKVDHCLPADQIAALLTRLSREPVTDPPDSASSRELEIETDIAEQQMNTGQLMNGIEAIGARSVYTCPSCNGSLWQIGKDEPLRFRCHVGHSFTAESLLSEQTRSLENALWSAVRLMEEKVMVAHRMAERRRTLDLSEAATAYEHYALHLEDEVEAIRALILSGFATRHLALGDEKKT